MKMPARLPHEEIKRNYRTERDPNAQYRIFPCEIREELDEDE